MDSVFGQPTILPLLLIQADESGKPSHPTAREMPLVAHLHRTGQTIGIVECTVDTIPNLLAVHLAVCPSSHSPCRRDGSSS